MTHVTNERLFQRLRQFDDAHDEAASIGDTEFAQECADVASLIREALAWRLPVTIPASRQTFVSTPRFEVLPFQRLWVAEKSRQCGLAWAVKTRTKRSQESGGRHS
ncbi:hypothetical protein ACSVNO_05920 [Salmonella enterica]|uniref:hypothetical protein n=1 Tax=Salmonella enterica TaxID=28901 RepID=UPI003F2FE9AD|nr:hypothetical protein [Salmonella enterica subsp. enterica serovar Yaba]